MKQLSYYRLGWEEVEDIRGGAVPTAKVVGKVDLIDLDEFGVVAGLSQHGYRESAERAGFRAVVVEPAMSSDWTTAVFRRP